MEETDAPLLFQRSLSSISPYTRGSGLWVITGAARVACTVQMQRLKNGAAMSAVTAGRKILWLLRLQTGGHP